MRRSRGLGDVYKRQPIPGTKRVKYLEENAGAMDVKLSHSELAEIDAVFPPDSALGDRYQANMMGSINA